MKVLEQKIARLTQRVRRLKQQLVSGSTRRAVKPVDATTVWKRTAGAISKKRAGQWLRALAKSRQNWDRDIAV